MFVYRKTQQKFRIKITKHNTLASWLHLAHCSIFKVFCCRACAEVCHFQQLATFCRLISHGIKELGILLPQFLIKFYPVHVLGVYLGFPGIHVDGWHSDAEKNTCCCLEKWLFHLLKARQTCIFLLPERSENHTQFAGRTF